jgi:hypothetical protein
MEGSYISNVTCHPTADWTLQQLRECVAGDEGYRFAIHDRDSIYCKELDAALQHPFCTVYIMNTAWRNSLHDGDCSENLRIHFLRTTGWQFAVLFRWKIGESTRAEPYDLT